MRKNKLKPGNLGRDCLYNGEHLNKRGKLIECCCDECDYMLCCIKENSEDECLKYTDYNCNSNKNNTANHSFFDLRIP